MWSNDATRYYGTISARGWIRDSGSRRTGPRRAASLDPSRLDRARPSPHDRRPMRLSRASLIAVALGLPVAVRVVGVIRNGRRRNADDLLALRHGV